MILPFLLSFLVLPLEGWFTNSPNVHLSDVLRQKCDALPYRTAYVGIRCYFAVAREVAYNDASALCSSVFRGSNVASNLPVAIFTSMMVEPSNYHLDSDSSGSKHAMCVYDSGYQCDEGYQSSVVPEKCIGRADRPLSYLGAEKYCTRLGMELPSIGNDLENRIVRDALFKNPAWIRKTYDSQWKSDKSFARFGSCDWSSKRPRWIATKMQDLCRSKLATVLDSNGYWGNDGQDALFDVVCVKSADNDFNRVKGKKCVALHEWDDQTGQCEWTGAKDACAQLIDIHNKTWFMPLPDFPKKTVHELDLYFSGNPQNDNTLKVIVRAGCMFTGYAHCWGNYYMDDAQDWTLLANRAYGVHHVPSGHTGECPRIADGLTYIRCFCDPTEATLNDHEPSPPPRKRCIENHAYNETTQSCEWKLDSKFCGELITHEGRRQLIEIPNWPKNKHYDVDHFSNATKRAEKFHESITEIIVRQHCWATLLWGKNFERKTLPTAGYGRHQVASVYNGMLGSVGDGTHRVVCECLR